MVNGRLWIDQRRLCARAAAIVQGSAVPAVGLAVQAQHTASDASLYCLQAALPAVFCKTVFCCIAP